MLLIVLALALWPLSLAGLQWLYAGSLLQQLERGSPAWWLAELLVPLAQLGSLFLLWRALKPSGRPLTPWAGALFVWWLFPWQHLPQCLRCSPAEAGWHFCLLLGLWIDLPIALRLAALLLSVWFLPTALPGAAAALAWSSQGSLRAVSVLIAYTSGLFLYRPPGTLDVIVGVLGLILLIWQHEQKQLATLLAYGAVSGLLGLPSTAAVPALAVALVGARLEVRSRFAGLSVALLLTVALCSWGGIQIVRQLGVPWQRQAGWSQAWWPHSPHWWAERFGDRFDFSPDDLRVAEWLRQNGTAPGMVLTLSHPWESASTAILYRYFSGGKAGQGWLHGRFSLEAGWLKQTLRFAGSGLQTVVLRGAPSATDLGQPLFQSGDVQVFAGAGELSSRPIYDLKLVDQAGPAGLVQVQLWADGPVAASGPPPRLVLYPGANRIRLPASQKQRAFNFGGRVLAFPAIDLEHQVQHVHLVSPAVVSLPGNAPSPVRVKLRNDSTQPFELGSLPGLRFAFEGEVPQPVQNPGGALPPASVTEMELLLAPGASDQAQLRFVDPRGVEYPLGVLTVQVSP